MRKFCGTFNHWLYHPVDTSLICDDRALKLSECRNCRGIEAPKIKYPASKELIPKMITLNINKEEWIKAVREIQEDYNIGEGAKMDGPSARRIAILIGELYLSQFRGSLLKVPTIEKDSFDLAMEYRLRCDSLEREEKTKNKRQVLLTWGMDKASGMEGYTTQLKEWAIRGLLETQEIKKKEDEVYGTSDREESGSFDIRTGGIEDFGLEEAGIG